MPAPSPSPATSAGWPFRDATPPSAAGIERGIAWARLAMNAGGAATIAWLTDDRLAQARLPSLLGVAPRPFATALWAIHLLFALLVAVWLRRAPLSEGSIRLTTLCDAAFGFALHVAVEDGVASPFLLALGFPILATAMRGDRRTGTTITLLCGVLVLGAGFALGSPDGPGLTILRTIQFVFAGLMFTTLGYERRRLSDDVRILETHQLKSEIATDLHDNLAQSLTAINLQLASAAEMLRTGNAPGTSRLLGSLRDGVQKEYANLRGLMHTLTDSEASAAKDRSLHAIECRVAADIVLDGAQLEEVLQMLRESLRNARSHARASIVRVRASRAGAGFRLIVDDDGVGFPPGAVAPWSIVTRARHLGGTVTIATSPLGGASIAVEIPERR